jgi:hypothetical protein
MEAIAQIGRLREILSGANPKILEKQTDNTFRARGLLQANFIGPEAFAKAFKVSDLGTVPAIPDAVLKALDTGCPLFSGYTVQQTHKLVFIPSVVDGKPFTLNELLGLKYNRGTWGAPGFTDLAAYSPRFTAEKFANVSICEGSEGKWVFMPAWPPKNAFWRKSDVEQIRDLDNFPGYRTATALELATTIMLSYASSSDLIYGSGRFRCADTNPRMEALKVELNISVERARRFEYVPSDTKHRSLGRAITMKLD